MLDDNQQAKQFYEKMGQIIGQHVADSTHQEVANELRKIEPAARIAVEYVKVGDKQVIILQAPECLWPFMMTV